MESMLSLAAIHARWQAAGNSNPVSAAWKDYRRVGCKRLRKPMRARATTVWRGSNVSLGGGFICCGARRCCAGHACGPAWKRQPSLRQAWFASGAGRLAADRNLSPRRCPGGKLKGHGKYGPRKGMWARPTAVAEKNPGGADDHGSRGCGQGDGARSRALNEEKHQFRRTDASQWWLRPASIR